MGSEAQAGQRAVPRLSGRRDRRVVAAVALGGALGAPARYGISLAAHVDPGTFPWGTFWTNVSGSFALGLFLALVLERFPPSRYLRPFVATGFLGAYTTYSTFAVEADLLVKNGHLGIALIYVVASFGAGLTATWVGALPIRAAQGWRRRWQ
jgi:fluoride exporter